MKHLFFSFIFSFSCFASYAQDTITKRNSEKIVAKILEIGRDEIKYKKFDFQDGPLYIERKSEIKTIVYANGVKESFAEVNETRSVVSISDNNDYYSSKQESNDIDMWNSNRYTQKGRSLDERDMHTIMMKTKDKKLIALAGAAQDAKVGQYMGFAGIPLGIASYGLLWASLINGSSGGYLGVKPNPTYITGSAICALAAIACPIASGSFKKKRKTCNRAAVKLYNEKY